MQMQQHTVIISKRLYCKYLGAIDEAVKELGRDVKDDDAEKLIRLK